jgi:hypothetical protein
MSESLEQKLRRIEATLDSQAAGLADLEKSERPADQNLRILQKELSDLKRTAQVTPQFPSRGQPVVVMDMSKSGLPTEVSQIISARLKGLVSEDQLFKGLGFKT